MADEPITTMQKAFYFNMDKKKYGTIAEIGAGQDGFQRACFEIDFPSKFFNQRHNEVKLMVVSADVHAMGKTAGMNSSVRCQVE